MSSVIDALGLLTPYDTNLTKARFGPNTDGGYILLSETLAGESILSYGISTEYRFDEEMGGLGHTVFMFDHTIDGISSENPRLRFVKEGVGGEDDPAALIYRLDSHLTRCGITGSNLILKMDVEGCEYDALSALDHGVLGRFQQILIEVHNLHDLGDYGFRSKFTQLFTKLNSIFTIFHVHANNCDGQSGLKIIDGVPVSNLLELSLVRSDLVDRHQSKTLYPTLLDYPNTEQKDKYLWFYPFMPVSCGAEAFRDCFDRNEKLGADFYACYLARSAVKAQ